MTCTNYHEMMKNEIGEQRYHQLIEEAHRIYRHKQTAYRCGRGADGRISLEEFTERYVLEKVRGKK